MQLGDLANKGEAESGARRLGILHARHAVELFEDAGQVAFAEFRSPGPLLR